MGDDRAQSAAGSPLNASFRNPSLPKRGARGVARRRRRGSHDARSAIRLVCPGRRHTADPGCVDPGRSSLCTARDQYCNQRLTFENRCSRSKYASYRSARRLACVFARAMPDGYSRKVAKCLLGMNDQPGTIDPLAGGFIISIEECTGIERQAPTADAPCQIHSEPFKRLDSRLELGSPRLRQPSPVLFGWCP